MTGSQKVIKVLSIIVIVLSVLGLLSALGAIATGGALFTPDFQQALQQKNTAYTAASLAEDAYMLVVLGIGCAIGCVLNIIVGALGVRGANDPGKITPFWVVTIISFVLSVATLIYAIFAAATPFAFCSSIVSAALDGALFWFANNIKKQNA